MNREIKFRAWDGKKMLLNVGVHPHLCSDLSHDDEYYKDNQDGRWIIGLGFDSYKVMQYTGLKDKNGKEIYEGDILNVHIFAQELGLSLGVLEVEKEFKAEICYQEIGLWLQGNTEYESGYILWFNGIHEESFEVIGNIYENQELLK